MKKNERKSTLDALLQICQYVLYQWTTIPRIQEAIFVSSAGIAFFLPSKHFFHIHLKATMDLSDKRSLSS